MPDQTTMMLFRRVFLESPEGIMVFSQILRDLHYGQELATPDAQVRHNFATRLLRYCGLAGRSKAIPDILEALAHIPLGDRPVDEQAGRRESAAFKRMKYLGGGKKS